MVSAVDPRARGLDLSPGQGHCVVFLGKTLNSYSTIRFEAAASSSVVKSNCNCARDITVTVAFYHC